MHPPTSRWKDEPIRALHVIGRFLRLFFLDMPAMFLFGVSLTHSETSIARCWLPVCSHLYIINIRTMQLLPHSIPIRWGDCYIIISHIEHLLSIRILDSISQIVTRRNASHHGAWEWTFAPHASEAIVQSRLYALPVGTN